MDRVERKNDTRGWLRRIWDATLRTAEAMEVSPIEDLYDRIARLEREVAAIRADGPGNRAVGAGR